MSYFGELENTKNFIKILIGIIGILFIINLITIKSLISVSSNKTIQIQVPQFMESGEYAIGSTFASEGVHKMWVRVWIEEIASFSYQNIREKYKSIYPNSPSLMHLSKRMGCM